MTVETVGYIGLNHHHRAPYLESLGELPVEVTAACEPDESFDGDVPNLGDVPIYREPDALLDEADVDAVWITLSNRDTPDVIRAAVERGIHVYTEKPAARTAADLAPVAEAVADSDATVCVSLNWRWHPIAQELKERLADGFFGDVRSFHTRFVASSLYERGYDHYIYDRAASRGGIVQWLGVHYLDLLSWFFDEAGTDDPIRRINATLSYGTPEVDVEDGASLQLETASGAHGSHDCGYYLREGRYDTQVNLYGSEAQSTWDPMGPVFDFSGETELELDARTDEWASTPNRTITYSYDPTPGYGGQYGLDFMTDFLAACEGNGDPPVDIWEGLRLLRILDAVYESAESDGWVDVAPEGTYASRP